MHWNKWILGLIAATILTLVSISASLAADLAGTYVTEDTKGDSFTIVLGSDSTARGEKGGHTLEGKWSVAGDAAVIEWTTGWTTKISADGDGYKKTAYRPGAPIDGEPANEKAIEKVK